jgi:hypothetical protein
LGEEILSRDMMGKEVGSGLLREVKMTQCEHDFQLDPTDGQVKCIRCGDLDDEMQLPNPGLEKKEEKDDFYKTQINFE